MELDAINYYIIKQLREGQKSPMSFEYPHRFT